MDKKITTLFVDIGGVLLTNGWDRESRNLAAQTFHLNFDEMEDRHRLMFNAYELGKINMTEYLHHVVFYEKRSFSKTEFQKFIFAQSKPYPDMIELICRLKAQYGLKIAVLSNEAYELNAYRIKKFKLRHFVDFFISSCFVHLCKPDPDIFQMALDIAQTPCEQVVYIDNLALFIDVARKIGIKGIHHEDYLSTRKQLAKFGLKFEGDVGMTADMRGEVG